MFTFTLVAILGILLVIVLMQLFKKTPAPVAAPAAPAVDLANLKVTDARVGDLLSIAGAGDRMTDLDFTVERGTRYEAGARTWRRIARKTMPNPKKKNPLATRAREPAIPL